MKLDVQTLAFILSLTGITQVIALSIQYRVNSAYRGIEWWLLGSTAMALGFSVLAMGTVRFIGILAVLGNPLLILGRICLFIGTLRFIGKRENPWITTLVFIILILFYYYYLFYDDNITARTVVVSTAIALFSLSTAHVLLFEDNKGFTASAKFTAAIFLSHGCYLIILIGYTLFFHTIHAFTDFGPLQIAAFIVPTVTSTLWTFGFILMVNQRLSAENLEEKENLQRVFNTGPDAALITRLEDGLLVDANLGFSVMTGYTRAETIGRSTDDIHVWSSSSDRQHFVSELKGNGFCENREFVCRRKDGGQFVGMISARVITIHGQPHIISVTRDITERKLSEEALRESEETYRSILNASPDDITITDMAGRILIVSPAANAMFGYGPGEGIGSNLLDFLVPEDQVRARANIQLMHLEGRPGPNEYRAVRKNGGILDIEVNSGIIRGAHGQPSKMVFIVRDITGRKRAEAERAELETRNRQLQKAESLGRMAGAIAHHFNNHLQSVLGNLELMSEFPNGIDRAACMAGARQATERAAEMSRLMLAYLGQAPREQEPRLLSELCASGLPMLRDGLPEAVALEADLPSPGPVIRANATQLQQVLSNLVTNAWEAMSGAPGQIRITLSVCTREELPTAHRFPIDWQPKGREFACLEVADTGGGIADTDMEQVFDPFFTTRFTGRGLGLSVVLGIIQAHGGAISVASDQGLGSRFRVLLPICAEGAPLLTDVPAQAQRSGAGGTILLVDDDAMLLQSTGGLIERMGYSLLTASDGVEAMEVFKLRKDEIRCVITDLTMPRMDGWETLTALRRLEPSLPVILASGYDRSQVMTGEHPELPQVFLGKPFGLSKLRDAISQALGRI